MGKIGTYLKLLFIFISNSMMGQMSSQNDSLMELTPNFENIQSLQPMVNQKLHMSLDIGAGIIGSKYFSGTYTSIAPNFSYLLSSKLKLEVGAAFISGNYNFYKLPAELSSKFQPKNDLLFVYTRGEYLLTDKLILSGTLYKSLNTNSSNQINPYFTDYKGMSIGLDYKLGEHMSFGAQFNFSNGYNNNLFNMGGYGISPIQQNFMGW